MHGRTCVVATALSLDLTLLKFHNASKMKHSHVHMFESLGSKVNQKELNLFI